MVLTSSPACSRGAPAFRSVSALFKMDLGFVSGCFLLFNRLGLIGLISRQDTVGRVAGQSHEFLSGKSARFWIAWLVVVSTGHGVSLWKTPARTHLILLNFLIIS
jgi:hypothetical protein